MDGTTPPTDDLANLSLQDDNQTPVAASPNVMMVDAPEEHVVHTNGTETEEVAIINPDSMEADAPLLASDCTSGPPSLLPHSSLTPPQMRR